MSNKDVVDSEEPCKCRAELAGYRCCRCGSLIGEDCSAKCIDCEQRMCVETCEATKVDEPHLCEQHEKYAEAVEQAQFAPESTEVAA